MVHPYIVHHWTVYFRDRALFPYSDFRCLSSLTTDGNSYVVPSILKCDDPSDQTACLASLSCEYCSVVVVPTSGFTFSSVAGQCGCTGTCNSDNSCAENAILNIQNQCECIFDTIAALDESSNEKCQEVNLKYYSIGMEKCFGMVLRNKYDCFSKADLEQIGLLHLKCFGRERTVSKQSYFSLSTLTEAVLFAPKHSDRSSR